jgi:hypothetical protein
MGYAYERREGLKSQNIKFLPDASAFSPHATRIKRDAPI